MLWTPQKGRTTIITNMPIVGSATIGTAVPLANTTLQPGPVTEIISAAQNIQDSWGLYIYITEAGFFAQNTPGVIDVLIGGATDDILIPTLIVGNSDNGRSGREYFFPLHIPKGKRIAAVITSVATNALITNGARVLVQLYGGSPPPFRVGRKVTAYGTPINAARGQAIVPSQTGAAASVTEMVAATAEDHFAFIPAFQCQDTTMSNLKYNIGIGVGASVEDRIGSWVFVQNSNEVIGGPLPFMPAFQDVPAGSRLTMLASNSGSNDASYDGFIYAVS